jgi:DNA polymerase I
MAAAAAMEHFGVPIDVPLLSTLRERWTGIQDQLIAEIDRDYGVYDGRVFKKVRFASWLARNGIPWPRLESGELDLDKDVWRQAAKAHLFVAPLYELRTSLSQLRLSGLTVGSDGRNRCVLWPFRAKTGRNQPSNSQFIFGPATWVRGLIKPPPGYGLAYVDWSHQEFGIAAVLSGDQAMIAAYEEGNPYLALAKRVNAVPADATKHTHPQEHQQFKQCSLGRLYGQGVNGLAAVIGQSTLVASELIRHHQETFPRFRRWSDVVVDDAILKGSIRTVFGWQMRVTAEFNPRSLRNFPMQGNAAEMMRLACCLATEGASRSARQIHDAVMIMAPLERLDDDVAAMQVAMGEASRVVLEGYELETDVKVVRYPDRYMDPRGEVMWRRVMQLIGGRGDRGDRGDQSLTI